MQASNPTHTPDRESLSSLSRVLEKHFPRPVEDTELVLMEVSPHRLHAYWHITPWELESAGARLHEKNPQLVLRFHDLTEQPPSQGTAPSFDIEVSGLSGSQYVELWEDARSYRAELGVLRKNGQLIDLARSNTVVLPKAGHTDKYGTQVLTLTPMADTLFESAPGIDAEASAEQQKARGAWQADDNQLNDATLQQGLRELFPLFPDPGAPVFAAHTLELDFTAEKMASSGPSAQAIETPQAIDLSLPPGPAARSTGPKHAPRQVDLRSPETSVPPTADAPDVEKKTDRFPLCSITDALALSKERIEPLIPLDSLQAAAAKIPAGFAFAPAKRRPASPAPGAGVTADNAGASDTPGSPQPVSSFSLVESQDQELHIELHIHGRAQPNSQFVFQGQIIATEADGSFSLKKTLSPDTRQLIAQLLAGSHSREA